MKTKMVFMIVFSLFASAVFSNEIPVSSVINSETTNAQVQLDQSQMPQPKTSGSTWDGILQMSKSDRENSRISIEGGKDLPQEVSAVIDNVAKLWNEGNYDGATALISELSDVDDVAIGCQWINPVATGDGGRWDDDIRIGNRTDIFDNEFDIHRASGNLFVILMYPNGNNYEWSVNLSTDGGDTWVETYVWWASFYIPDVSASVVGDYCYVAYAGTASLDAARIRRFNTADGSAATFPDGSDWVTCFGTLSPIKEITLVSNQDYFNNRLYYFTVLQDGNLGYFWNVPTGVLWNQVITNIWDADRGLDVSCNEGYSTYFMFASYINTNDTLKIWGISPLTQLRAFYIGATTEITAIGAFDDTITCAFDYDSGSNLFCYYLVNYTGGGGTWYAGSFDNVNVTSESPDLTARDGGGVGIVYRYYTIPREERYVWRDYAGSWSSPLSVADNAPWWNQPNIEYLGGGNYGVVYLSWTSPFTQAAYFDYLDNVTAVPCCDVSMTPDTSPVVVPHGGSFGLTGTIGNPTAAPIQTDVWVGVIYLGTFYQLWLFNNIPLNPGQYISAHMNQSVPNYAPAGTYIYRAYCGDRPTNVKCDSFSFNFTVTGARVDGGADDWTLEGGFNSVDMPTDYALVGCYPNPFNATTTITYALPSAGNVNLDVYNLAGQRVATLVNGYNDAGQHNIVWDGSGYSSGIYFYRLTAGDFTQTKRMTLLK